VTPEQERKLDRVLDTVSGLANQHLQAHERINALERKVKLLGQWLNRLLQGPPPEGAPPRPTLPSLSAEDSGSIEISAFGTSGKFTGKWPVRFALGLLLSAGMLVLGWISHALLR